MVKIYEYAILNKNNYLYFLILPFNFFNNTREEIRETYILKINGNAIYRQEGTVIWDILLGIEVR